MTVRELIKVLSQFDAGMEVRLAAQPTWPHQFGVGSVVVASGDRDEESDEPVVYIGEGEYIGYLGGEAQAALGWG